MSNEKPEKLYHGSPNRNIEKFEPRVSLGTGEEHGALVYASPDLAISSVFLSRVDGQWSSGRFGDIPYALIPMSREEFIKNDAGGCVYILPSETFETKAGRGLGDKEWASPVTVTPTEKINYPSALEAMIEHGVQVYFLSPEEYQETRKATDRGRTFLASKESENQRRGENIQSF